MRVEFCIIGGGILGLATAMAILERRPGASVLLLEKQGEFGAHQTGHNSGVIHSGIYYDPGSLKARLCRQGCEELKQFCAEHAIPTPTPGKLVVATNAEERARLTALQARARTNGIDVDLVGKEQLSRLEPNVAGEAALLVPTTGIVDYRQVCIAMARRIRRLGGMTLLNTGVEAIAEHGADVILHLATDTLVFAKQLIVCAGLQSDRLARLAGLRPDVRIVPFRGEYYTLGTKLSNLVQRLIYPVPDPRYPFLGVHLTRHIDGSLSVGPNAVLGLARELYDRHAFDLRDTLETLGFPGFWRFAAGNWRPGLAELRASLAKRVYLALCRRYCPTLELDDLEHYSSGIRAQAMDRHGRLASDFVFAQTDRMLHVLNAPSPAATAAIPIGRTIADRILKGIGAPARRHLLCPA